MIKLHGFIGSRDQAAISTIKFLDCCRNWKYGAHSSYYPLQALQCFRNLTDVAPLLRAEAEATMQHTECFLNTVEPGLWAISTFIVQQLKYNTVLLPLVVVRLGPL